MTISNRSIIQELSTLDKRTLSRDNPQSSWTLIFKLNYSVRLVKAREMTSCSKRGFVLCKVLLSGQLKNQDCIVDWTAD